MKMHVQMSQMADWCVRFLSSPSALLWTLRPLVLRGPRAWGRTADLELRGTFLTAVMTTWCYLKALDATERGAVCRCQKAQRSTFLR